MTMQRLPLGASDPSVDHVTGARGVVPLMDTLAINTITVTAVSSTLAVLLAAAGGAIQADLKRLSLEPAADVSRAIGAAAVAGVNVLAGGACYELPANANTDLRLIAGGNVAVVVTQEG